VPIGWRSIGVTAAKAALKPAIDALKPQLARRGALEVAGQVSMASEPEIDEAIRLLSEEEASLPRFIAAQAKKMLSDIPDVFADPEVRLWLQHKEVRSLVASSARAAIAAQSYDDHRRAAAMSFAEALADDLWWGEFVFDVAVAFVALSVKGKMNPGQRAVLDSVTFQNAQISEKQERLSDQIAGVAELVSSGVQQPADAVRALIEPIVERDDRLRSLVDPSRPDRLLRLAKRVESGDLCAAEQDVRIKLFRTTAAALCREKRPDDAEHWIEAARNAGANDLYPDLARLEIAKGNFDRALELLRDRRDCLSVMLTAEAINKRDRPTAGLEYVRQTISPADMTGWALASYASWLTEVGAWEDAEAVLAQATPDQVDENPLILYGRMRLRLALMVNPPSDRLPLVQSDHGLPIPGRLRNDAEGQRLRQCALADLRDFRALVPEAVAEHADWFEAQRLFLILSDPDRSETASALEELQERAAKPETAILFGWLAVSLDLSFDHQILRQELARKELLGELSGPELQAALGLTLRTDDAEDILRFLDRYGDQMLNADLPAGLVEGLKVEATAKAGEPRQARELLDQVRGVLGEQASASLEAVIAEVESGLASVELWRKAFEGSGNVNDLTHLVEAMAESNHADLGKFAIELWSKTHRVDLAAKAANALFNEGRDTELDQLLSHIGDAGDSDEYILKHKAWGAFRAGKLDEARELVLAQRKRLPDDAGLRQLEINIGLESGHWNSLAHIGHQDLERRENRDARQLLQGAGLAQLVDDPVADDLARAAVSKAPTDPEILIGAFSSAIQRGTDWGTEAGGWLRSAVEHSGEDGPLKSAPLRDFVEMAKEGQERNENLNRMIMAGELPLELAAQPLGVTLSELILIRLSKNASERDARQKLCLPLIAGNRLKTDLSAFSTFAFDLSSLLALEMIDLLDATLDELPHILLAAGTMPYLFQDYMRAQRGQKSRASQAQAIEELLGPNGIEVRQRPQGSEQEASELALARSLDAQYVHSFPIHEPGSLGEKVMDVGGDEDIIVSPSAVIDALEADGEIDSFRANACRSLLSDSRERWPSERDVDLERPLLLHIVALNALQSAGVLETLVSARKRIIISDEAEEQINRELREWQQLQQPLQAIERLRDKLVAASASGKATHGGYRRRTEEDRDEPQNSQLIALLKDASAYEVLVSGERAINKLGKLTDTNGVTRPIATIIDVIDYLHERGRIDARQRSEARQRLRESGVAFVPVEIGEIVEAAAQGNWTNGPSKPFRAIIDSVHLPLVRGALVLPDELYWFGNVQLQFVRAIERCWIELPIERAEQASSWLLHALPDPMTLVRETGARDLEAWAPNARVALYRTLAQPLSIPAERLDDYHEWFASNVGPQIGGRDRHIRPILIDALAEASSDVEPVSLEDGEQLSRDEVTRWMLLRIPPNLREQTLRTDRVQEVLGLSAGRVRIGGRVVSPESLFDFVRATFEGRTVPMMDVEGIEVASGGDWDANTGVVVNSPDGSVNLDFAGVLHDDPAIRLATFKRLCATTTFPHRDVSEWSNKIAEAPVSMDELKILLGAFRRAPERWLQDFRGKVGDLTLFDLQVGELAYYETFFQLWTGLPLSQILRQAVERRAEQGNLAHVAFLIAPLAIATDFDVKALVAALTDKEVAELASELAHAGDLFSAVAALQIVSSRLESEDCVNVGSEVLDAYLGTSERMEEAAHDFVALAKAVIGYADINGTLSDAPNAERRCALLAHAGLLTREFSKLEVERPKFLEMVERWIGNSYRLAGLVERSSERWWIRERLHPLIIAAQVRMRLKAIIRSLPEDDRPSAWSTHLSADGAGVPDIVEYSTGPLDEYSSNWRVETFPSSEVASAIASGEIARDQSALFNALLAFEQPSDLDASRDSVIELLERSTGDAFAQSVELALTAAARWKDKLLAEETFALAFEREAGGKWTYRSFAELAVASAASSTDAAEYAVILEKNLRILVERRLTPSEAQDMVGILDKLQDLIPDLACLPTLRSAALLAA